MDRHSASPSFDIPTHVHTTISDNNNNNNNNKNDDDDDQFLDDDNDDDDYYLGSFNKKNKKKQNSNTHDSEATTDMQQHQKEKRKRERQQREKIAARESKAVTWLRVVVLFVLLACTVTTSRYVYWYITKTQQEEFTAQFQSDATKLLEAIGITLGTTFGATDSFIANIIAYAKYTNSTWPFVTLPEFAIQASKVLTLSKSFHIGVNHAVSVSNRWQWENQYTPASDDWILTSLQVKQQDPSFLGSTADADTATTTTTTTTTTTIVDYNVSHFIHTATGPSDKPLPYHDNNTYFPAWQQAPVVPNYGNGYVYNFDILSLPHIAKTIQASIQTRSIQLSRFANVISDPNDPIHIQDAEIATRWTSNYIDTTKEDPSEPTDTVVYPIFNDDSNINLVPSQTAPLVGVVTFTMFWRSLIRNILPENSNGIIVVFSEACANKFTYQVNGPNTIYLGGNDYHETKYDGKLQQTVTLVELLQQHDSTYTGLPLLDNQNCPKSISIYPSSEMENRFINANNHAIVFSIVAAMIFLFTSILFVTYDCIVARRQRILIQRARASGAIVSSLFPENVKRQLYQEQKEALRQKFQSIHESSSSSKEKRKSLSSSNSDLATLPLDTATSNNNNNRTVKKSKPIADLFHDTTVLFADLAGFTFWSSDKSPVEVFELLERIYGTFDTIALKHGVYKIETIGDCYVAVTGCPEPRTDHAVCMTMFAQECIQALDQVLSLLSSKSQQQDEESTTTSKKIKIIPLSMRVGMHSGSTTAGVLRGDKSRFQLFGPTVNKAAQMESCGQKGKIHISTATANELIKFGKYTWLSPREMLIKGEQTYWVSIVGGEKQQQQEQLKDNEQSSDKNNDNGQLEHQQSWKISVEKRQSSLTDLQPSS